MPVRGQGKKQKAAALEARNAKITAGFKHTGKSLRSIAAMVRLLSDYQEYSGESVDEITARCADGWDAESFESLLIIALLNTDHEKEEIENMLLDIRCETVVYDARWVLNALVKSGDLVRCRSHLPEVSPKVSE